MVNEKVAIADRRLHALELRRAGADYQSIAQATGYSSAAAAYRAVKSALLKCMKEPAAEVRQHEIDRLDKIMLSLWPKAMAGDLESIDRVLKIMARRAAYLGLDAPKEMHMAGTQVNVSVNTSRQIYAELGRVLADDPVKKAQVEELLRRQIACTNVPRDTNGTSEANADVSHSS